MKTKEILIEEIVNLQRELTEKRTQESKNTIEKICSSIDLLSIDDLKIVIECMIELSMYDKAVEVVAKKYNLEFKAEFLENNYHFQGDKDKRDIYNITLKRVNRKYIFKFGQSLNKSGFYAQYGRQKYDLPREKMDLKNHELVIYVKRQFNRDFKNATKDTIIYPIAPTLYDVLTCLQKYEVGTFENFCDDFGYDTDSRTAKKTYKAVVKEYDKMCSLFSNDELEVLQLIS